MSKRAEIASISLGRKIFVRDVGNSIKESAVGVVHKNQRGICISFFLHVSEVVHNLPNGFAVCFCYLATNKDGAHGSKC